MIQRFYLVIGAGAGGDAVCEGIRQYDKKNTVLLVGAENRPPYDRTALSKSFLSEAKPNPDSLALHPADHYQNLKIDFRPGVVVTQFNIERRIAVLSTGQAVQFEKACLATGSRPRRPQVAGATLGNVFYPRTPAEVLALREVIAGKSEVAVIGGGLLAAEICSSLRKLKCAITLLDRNPFFLHNTVDPETSEWLTSQFQEHGVNVLSRESLNGFEGKTVLRNIQTKSGARFSAKAAVVAIGAEPNLDLVRNTPLSSPLGTPVNDLLETEEKGVYAVGDIALYPDKIFGGVRRVEHWDSARAQGLVAGANMTAKKRIRYSRMPDHSTTILDLQLRFIGDFSLPPSRVELEGSRAKKSFVAQYFNGDKLRAALLCNRKDAEKIAKSVAEQIKATSSA